MFFSPERIYILELHTTVILSRVIKSDSMDKPKVVKFEFECVSYGWQKIYQLLYQDLILHLNPCRATINFKIWLYQLSLISILQWYFHYNDVTMSAMASQITSFTIVYSTVYSGADQRKHQSSASLAFVRGIHRWPLNSPHTWPVTWKMFPFDDVIMFTNVCISC